MFRKTALHELGHVMGLDEVNGTGGSSVMNSPSGVNNDPNGNMPMTVTECDGRRAKAASMQ
jgi:predicted Zn-dependent protease